MRRPAPAILFLAGVLTILPALDRICRLSCEGSTGGPAAAEGSEGGSCHEGGPVEGSQPPPDPTGPCRTHPASEALLSAPLAGAAPSVPSFAAIEIPAHSSPALSALVRATGLTVRQCDRSPGSFPPAILRI